MEELRGQEKIITSTFELLRSEKKKISAKLLEMPPALCPHCPKTNSVGPPARLPLNRSNVIAPQPGSGEHSVKLADAGLEMFSSTKLSEFPPVVDEESEKKTAQSSLAAKGKQAK